MNDGTLIRRYVDEGSEAAFADIVRRYHPMVYATCRRDVIDRDLAADVTQATFLVLARKAPQLRSYRSLAGWLFNTARLAAKDAMKQERRRKIREQMLMNEAVHSQNTQGNERAWSVIEPCLNDALGKLTPVDREAVLLRYVDGCASAEVGTALGLSEEAAKKRVARAVDKLRRHLSGVAPTLSIALLATLLAEHASEAMPANGVDALISSLRTPGARPAAISHTVHHAMNAARVTASVATAAATIVVGTAGVAVLHYTSRSVSHKSAHVRAVAAVSAPPAPLLLPTATSLPVVATPAQALADAPTATSVTPAVASIRYPELNGDFTLSYAVKEVDPVTNAVRRRYRLIISHHNASLLTVRYDQTAPNARQTAGLTVRPDSWTTLYDGVRTYSMSNLDSTANAQEGFHCADLVAAPSLGVNIPYFPFVKAYKEYTTTGPVFIDGVGQVMQQASESGEPIYAAAHVSGIAYNTYLMPNACTLRSGQQTIETVRFTQTEPLGNVGIPRISQITLFAASGRPTVIVDGYLIDAKAESLPAADFDVDSLQPLNRDVSDRSE